MHLRDARPDDAEAIAAVARASWHAAYDDLLGPDTVDSTVDDWYDPVGLREQVSDGVFLVAVEDGVVGFTQAGPATAADRDAVLPRIYVHPDHWSEGIGTALLQAVADRLLDRGHERLWLEVFAANDLGCSFYDAHGFEEVGRNTETFGDRDLLILRLEADLQDVASD